MSDIFNVIFDSIYNILGVFCIIYALYYFFMAFPAFLKKKELESKPKKTKFGVLIAARNEENVIGELIDSLNEQNYKKDLFDTIVLVNNCTDDTKGEALKHGAKVLDVDVPVKTKGDVLYFAKDKLKNEKYDAYIIFDADNIVDKNFLSEMNNVYQNGYMVAQGFRDAKNLSDNWLTASYSIFYYIQNYFFNLSRRNINKSALINGTGFMVDKKYFEEKFKPITITEDVEFTATCVLDHRSVYFADKAITYDEHTPNFWDSWKQRKRWSKGMVQNLYKNGFGLIKGMFTNISCIDLLFNFMAPYIQILSVILTSILFLKSLNNIYFLNISLLTFTNTFAFGSLVFLGMIFVNLYVVLYNKRTFKEAYSGIFLFCIFMVSWLPINFDAIISGDINWDPIKHGKR